MIEVDAEPKQATSSKAGSAKLAALKNAPRVGSKLRNSFQVEKDEQSGDDDIVVKTVAVALNPMDWKRAHALPSSSTCCSP